MSDAVMRKEYPKTDQRFAICKKQWDSRSKHCETRSFKMKDLVCNASGMLQFSESKNDDIPKGNTPVELVIRTHSPVRTWFGDIIHDFQGMSAKDKVPLDWTHNTREPNEVIGFLDRFEKNDDEIRAFGQLASIKEDDVADQVVKKLKQGVPFESSICFGGQGLVIEEVDAHNSVSVNNKKFKGPGLVVRQWPLRGVAVCAYGADNSTSTSLALSEEEVVVDIINNGGLNMSKELSVEEQAVLEAEKLEADKLAAEKLQAELDVEAAELEAAKNKKTELVASDGTPAQMFLDRFKEQGAVWFAQGKTLVEATELHIVQLEAKVIELEKRLKAACVGSNEVIEFNDEGDTEKNKVDEKVRSLTPKIGASLARFAATLNLRK